MNIRTAGLKPDWIPDAVLRRAPVFQLFAISALIWLLVRPYQGIVHDARLYGLQALARVSPGAFHADLFLAYGSQDSFSIFSLIVRPLCPLMGISGAMALGYGLASAVFVSGLVLFTGALTANGKLRLWMVLGALCLPSGYGGFGVLRYGEPFLTPRLIAEGFVLLAFASLLRGSMKSVSATGLLALLFHPIVAALAMSVAAAWAVIQWLSDRKIALSMVLAAAAAMVLALGFAGIDPFQRLLRQMDGPWFAIVSHRSPFVLVSSWRMAEILTALSSLFTAYVFSTTLEKSPRLFVRCAISVAIFLVFAAYLFGDLAHNILFLNIQPWRILWLVQLIGNIALVSFATQPAGGAARVLSLVAILVGSLSVCVAMPAILPPIWTASAALAVLLESRRSRIWGDAQWLSLGLLCVFTIVVSQRVLQWPTSNQLTRLALEFFALALVISVVSPRIRQTRPWAPITILAVIFVAIFNFDARSPSQRMTEAPSIADQLQMAPVQAKPVFTPFEPTMTWFRLERPSYFTCAQGAGAMFFKATAIEWSRRADVVRSAYGLKSVCGHDDEDFSRRSLSAAGLDMLCADMTVGARVLLAKPVSGRTGSLWIPPTRLIVSSQSGTPRATDIDRLYLYECGMNRVGSMAQALSP